MIFLSKKLRLDLNLGSAVFAYMVFFVRHLYDIFNSFFEFILNS